MLEHLDKPYQDVKSLPSGSLTLPKDIMTNYGLSESEVQVVVMQILLDELVDPVVRPFSDPPAEWLPVDKLMTLGHLRPDEIQIAFKRK